MDIGLDLTKMVDVSSFSDLAEVTDTPTEDVTTDDKKKVSGTVVDETLDVNKFFETSDTETNEIENEDELEETKKTGENSNDDKKTLDSSPSSDETTESSSNIPFNLIFKSLADEGALSSFDEESFEADVKESGYATAIVNATQRHLEEVTNARLAELEEDVKEYSSLKDLAFSPEEAKELISSKIQFDKISPEDLESEEKVELRKNILTQNFKNTTKFSEDRINKLVEKIIDSGTDIEDAKEALSDIKEYNKQVIADAKAKKIQDEQNRVKQLEDVKKRYNDFIDKLEEPIPGVKLNKTSKDKLKEFTLNGGLIQAREKDPIKFDSLVSYLVMNGLMEGKFDKQLKISKSSAIKDIENAIKTTKNKNVKSVSNLNVSKETEEDDNILISGLNAISKQRSTF